MTVVFYSSGGLFDNDEEENVENAFKYAVYRVSHERGLLTNTQMKYDIQRLPVYNSFDSSKKSKNFDYINIFKLGKKLVGAKCADHNITLTLASPLPTGLEPR